MRLQTQWLRWVVGVFTLIATLSSISITPAFAQVSLFDPTFNVGPGANGTVYSIVIQDDGKIIVGGEFTQIAGQARTNLARLKSDGQLDTSFPGGTDGTVYRLLQQSDGKILVAGAFTNLQGAARRGIGRLLNNGDADPAFDAGNVLGGYESAFTLAVQPDNKILVGTVVFPFTNSALFRLHSSGQLDESFVQTNLFRTWHIFAICPRTNGSILLGGGFQSVNDFDTVGLALLHENGQLDTNFTSQLTNSNPTSIIEQADGSLLIGGGMWFEGATNRTMLARLTPNLAWDSNFHPAAIDPTISVSGYGYVYCMLPLPEGKVVLGGNFHEVGGFWRRGIVRLDSDGQVDRCFDPGLGLAPNNINGALALARQPDGKIVVGGDFVDVLSERKSIVRLLPQSDCDNMRAYVGIRANGSFYVAATFPPGGTNILQVSSNLVDWIDKDISTGPYCFAPKFESWPVSDTPCIFVRGKKQY